MAWFAAAAPYIAAATTAYAAVEGAKADRRAGDMEQEQYLREAAATKAAGTREAAAEARKGRIAASNARAAMAASGGLTTDEQAVKQIGQIESRADYNTLAALFDAESESSGLTFRGDVAKWTGKSKARAGTMSAFSTTVGSMGSFASTYNK